MRPIALFNVLFDKTGSKTLVNLRLNQLDQLLGKVREAFISCDTEACSSGSSYKEQEQKESSNCTELNSST